MQQRIEVKTVGEPTLDTFSENEKTAFYTILLMRIQQLAKGGK